MATLSLSNEQLIELIKQLPSQQQAELFKYLTLQQWSTWKSLSNYGAGRARIVAQEHGLNWDAMVEEEHETFINDVVQED